MEVWGRSYLVVSRWYLVRKRLGINVGVAADKNSRLI